jgi:hypothetical protein
MIAPLVRFIWNGEAMVPHGASASKLCDRHYVIGQTYMLEEASERSWVSHSHQFAWLAEAHANLPEALADQFPTAEHLRKAALIATGQFKERIINAKSRALAAQIAAFVTWDDEFASVEVNGLTVIVRKAVSQRMTGPGRMSKAEFQRSKDKIMTWVAQLIGVEPEQLRETG